MRVGRIVEVAAALALTVAALGFVVVQASATDERETAIEVSDAWARPSIGQTDTSAVYMTIRNPSQDSDTLLEAESDVAQSVELHRHVREGDVMRMRRVENGVEVPAGGTVAFEPGNLHVMLIGLARELKSDSVFTLTLRFERAGTLTTDVAVRMAAPEAGGPHDDDGHEGHDH